MTNIERVALLIHQNEFVSYFELTQHHPKIARQLSAIIFSLRNNYKIDIVTSVNNLTGDIFYTGTIPYVILESIAKNSAKYELMIANKRTNEVS